jgi:lipopolysaccharide transport system permease protein
VKARSRTARSVEIQGSPDEIVIDAHHSTPIWQAGRELAAHSEIVIAFGRRSFQIRYKQSVLGVLWAVVQPLATLVVFVIFFGKVAKISAGSVPYAAFVLSALVPWLFVSAAVSTGAGALITEAPLLRKVYFPRAAPVAGAMLASLVDLSVMLAVVLILNPFLGGHLGLSLISLPLLLVALIIPVLAVALPLAALSVYYRDVRYVLPFLLQLWMFASPVIYPLSRVPARWRDPYAAIDPLVGPLDGFHRVLALGIFPDWGLLAISALFSVAALIIGGRLFIRLTPELADVV